MINSIGDSTLYLKDGIIIITTIGYCENTHTPCPKFIVYKGDDKVYEGMSFREMLKWYEEK